MYQKESRDRVVMHECKELVDTVKALIEVYESAFGDRWESVFTMTVRVTVSAP